MGTLNHFTAYNQEMQQLARQFGAELRSEWGMKVANASTGGLKSQLKANAGRRYGVVDRVAAKFPRHGIFRMVGAGRGQAGSVGTTWRDKNGQTKRTNPNSFGKMDTGNRRAADWLSPTLDKFNEIVADRAAAHFATIGQQIALSSIPTTKTRR